MMIFKGFRKCFMVARRTACHSRIDELIRRPLLDVFFLYFLIIDKNSSTSSNRWRFVSPRWFKIRASVVKKLLENFVFIFNVTEFSFSAFTLRFFSNKYPHHRDTVGKLFMARKDLIFLHPFRKDFCMRDFWFLVF